MVSGDFGKRKILHTLHLMWLYIKMYVIEGGRLCLPDT